MNKLILSLLLLSGYANAASKNLCVGLLLAPVAREIKQENEAKRSLLEKIFGRKPVSEPASSGIRIFFALQKQSLEQPAGLENRGVLTITNFLEDLDSFICQKIVKEKRTLGLRPQDDISDEHFKRLNLIKKQYIDDLPAVLQEVYGETAKPYIRKIAAARQEFEAHHYGALLELH